MSAPTASTIRRPNRPSKHTSAVELIRRLPGGREQRLELQMRQPEGWGLRRHSRPTDVLGRRMLEDAVDDACAVEAGHHGQPTRHGRGLEQAHVLYPPQVELEIVAARVERRKLPVLTPGEEQSQVRLGVLPGRATVAR